MSKRTQTCIPWTKEYRKMKGNSKGKFEVFVETTISKFWSFDSSWWRHQPKNGWKKFRLVYHVPMLMERWKSKVKDILRLIIHLWNHPLKILKFWLKIMTSSTQNCLGKRSKLVSHVLLFMERWKPKVKRALRRDICLWKYFLKILKF